MIPHHSSSHPPMQSAHHRMRALTLLILATLTWGCDVSHITGIDGSGTLKTDLRPFPPVEAIEINGLLHVHLKTNQSNQLIEVSGDDNLVALVETSVQNKRLVVRQGNNIKPTHGLNLRLETAALKEIVVIGAIKLDALELSGGNIAVSVNGASLVNLTGQVDKLTMEVSGASQIDTTKLLAKEVVMAVNGASTARIYVSESLNATVSGASKIEYAGNPKDIVKKTDGATSITPL